MRVGVVGASGFMGGEAVRLLEMHPHAELTVVCGSESAGRRLSDVRPGLAGIDMTVAPADPSILEERCDAAILALPHGHSAPLAEELLKRGVLVIDLGSDFRLKDPDEVMKWYRREAPRRKLLDAAWYGLPELVGPPPEGTTLVAAPGCFATALCLLLAPLSGLGLEQASVFGITGSSGSGINPAPTVHHSLRSSDFWAYKPLAHQHLGEVSQLLSGRGWEPRISFIPHSAPLVRGIHLTAVLPVESSRVMEAFREAYEGQAFIRVREGSVHVGSVIGTNRAEIGVAPGDGETAVFCAIDNLVKGGAGQGIQNLNLIAGWPEASGLPMNGTWP